jgi:hypothetical protein
MARRLANQVKHSNWIRCYSSASHGWASTEFRTRCSNRGPTVTIAKDSLQGRIFGGYNANPWYNDNRGGWGSGNGFQNFIFRWHSGNFDWFNWRNSVCFSL